MASPATYRIRAGEMRHRVQLQNRVLTRDAVGGTVETWSTYDTVWSKIVPVSAREIIEGNQTEGRATHRIIIRHNGAMTRKNRILFGSRVFHVDSVVNVEERNKVQILVCTEDT